MAISDRALYEVLLLLFDGPLIMPKAQNPNLIISDRNAFYAHFKS